MPKGFKAGGRKAGDGNKKTGGRKEGTPNKITKKAKEVIVCIVDNNAEKAQKMLNLIVEPKDWLQIYIKLCEFVIPKQAAVTMSASAGTADLRTELQILAETEEQ